MRPFEPRDGPRLAELLASYVQEAYAGRWYGSDSALVADAAAQRVQLLVATADAGSIVGFVAWNHAYDLHFCMSGGNVLDLYVAPAARSRSVAVRLLSALARDVHARGGRFLKAQALAPHTPAYRLYARVAVMKDALDCTVSGRAFRRIAELAERPPREIARSLPPVAWTYEG